MNFSYGFIETKGYIAAIEAADAMVKAAQVEVIKWRKSGGALIIVVVRGELGACRAAVDAGAVAAGRVGELVSANVIPNPYGDTNILVEQFLGGRKKKKAQAEKKKPAKPGPAAKVIEKTELQKPAPAPKSKAGPTPAKAKPVKKTKAEPKKTVSKETKPKSAPPKKSVKKADPFSPQEKMLNLIASAPKGVTLNQLAEDFNKPIAEIRQLIKKLMDRNVVEKVQKHYFIIDSRSKK